MKNAIKRSETRVNKIAQNKIVQCVPGLKVQYGMIPSKHEG